MKLAQKSILRLKNILKSDKEKLSLPFMHMIKSDMFCVVSNYFDINIDDLKLSYSVDEDCMYVFAINFKTNRIKKTNFLNH